MKILYFAPVEKKYFERWEYYRVDLEVLRELADTVVVCHSLIEVVNVIHRVDLIYCWWWHRSAHVIALAKILRRPVITTGAIHMFDYSGKDDFYKKSLGYRLATQFALKYSDASLFISKDQLLQVTSHCTVTKPTLVYSSLSKEASSEKAWSERQNSEAISDPAPLPHFKFSTLCWHTSDQYVRKGIWETLAALRDTSEYFTYEWLVIGGAGEGANDLKAEVRKLGLDDHVKLMVDVSRSSINEILATTDLYLQPSWCEGFGNAVLEAMSFGTPALVSRYTAQPEVVGEDGFVCMDLTKEGIEKSIMDFVALTDCQRTELRERVASRARLTFGFGNRVFAIEKVINESIT